MSRKKCTKLRPRQRRQIAVNDNPIEAVIDEDQELAEQLGEDVHRLALPNGRSKPDRVKLCATAVGFDLPTRFATSSDRPPLVTDASSPPTSLSCSRPKQAMLGSSTPPISSPHASPATATRNPSPCRKPTPASKSLGPEATIRLDGPAFVCTDRHSRRLSTIVGYPTHLLAISNIFGWASNARHTLVADPVGLFRRKPSWSAGKIKRSDQPEFVWRLHSAEILLAK